MILAGVYTNQMRWVALFVSSFLVLGAQCGASQEAQGGAIQEFIYTPVESAAQVSLVLGNEISPWSVKDADLLLVGAFVQLISTFLKLVRVFKPREFVAMWIIGASLLVEVFKSQKPLEPVKVKPLPGKGIGLIVYLTSPKAEFHCHLEPSVQSRIKSLPEQISYLDSQALVLDTMVRTGDLSHGVYMLEQIDSRNRQARQSKSFLSVVAKISGLVGLFAILYSFVTAFEILTLWEVKEPSKIKDMISRRPLSFKNIMVSTISDFCLLRFYEFFFKFSLVDSMLVNFFALVVKDVTTRILEHRGPLGIFDTSLGLYVVFVILAWTYYNGGISRISGMSSWAALQIRRVASDPASFLTILRYSTLVVLVPLATLIAFVPRLWNTCIRDSYKMLYSKSVKFAGLASLLTPLDEMTAIPVIETVASGYGDGATMVGTYGKSFDYWGPPKDTLSLALRNSTTVPLLVPSKDSLNATKSEYSTAVGMLKPLDRGTSPTWTRLEKNYVFAFPILGLVAHLAVYLSKFRDTEVVSALSDSLVMASAHYNGQLQSSHLSPHKSEIFENMAKKILKVQDPKVVPRLVGIKGLFRGIIKLVRGWGLLLVAYFGQYLLVQFFVLYNTKAPWISRYSEALYYFKGLKSLMVSVMGTTLEKRMGEISKAGKINTKLSTMNLHVVKSLVAVLFEHFISLLPISAVGVLFFLYSVYQVWWGRYWKMSSSAARYAMELVNAVAIFAYIFAWMLLGWVITGRKFRIQKFDQAHMTVYLVQSGLQELIQILGENLPSMLCGHILARLNKDSFPTMWTDPIFGLSKEFLKHLSGSVGSALKLNSLVELVEIEENQ